MVPLEDKLFSVDAVARRRKADEAVQKVFGVYDKQGFLVDLSDWSDGEFAVLLASKLGTELHVHMVPPFDFRPRIPRSL